jgi:hypothetical protein
MNRERDPNFYDELLDHALRRYNAEPRAGLEHRVLAGVRSRQAEMRTKRAVWLRWQFAGAAAAAMVLLAVGITTLHRPAPQVAARALTQRPVTMPQQNSLARPGSTAEVQAPSVHAVLRRRKAITATTKVGLPSRPGFGSRGEVPRLAVFPSPTPPTSDEQLLASTLRRADRSALAVLAATSRVDELAPPATPIMASDAEEIPGSQPPQY